MVAVNRTGQKQRLTGLQLICERTKREKYYTLYVPLKMPPSAVAEYIDGKLFPALNYAIWEEVDAVVKAKLGGIPTNSPETEPIEGLMIVVYSPYFPNTGK